MSILSSEHTLPFPGQGLHSQAKQAPLCLRTPHTRTFFREDGCLFVLKIGFRKRWKCSAGYRALRTWLPGIGGLMDGRKALGLNQFHPATIRLEGGMEAA